MRKTLLLMIALITTNSILPAVISVKNMMHDIKEIIHDQLTGQSDEQRLGKVRTILCDLEDYKKSKERQIISLHTNQQDAKTGSLFVAGLTGIACFLEVVSPYVKSTPVTILEITVTGIVGLTGSLLIKYNDKIIIYYLKQDIHKINEAITRLEIMEKALSTKINTNYVVEQLNLSQKDDEIMNSIDDLYKKIDNLEDFFTNKIELNNEVIQRLEKIMVELQEK